MNAVTFDTHAAVRERQRLAGYGGGREDTMKTRDPMLEIRFDGAAVGSGTIPVSHLIHFLANLSKALQRTGRLLHGSGRSLRRAQPSARIKEAVELDLVLLTQGSPAAVLGFERRSAAARLTGPDIGMQVFETAVGSIDAVQRGGRNDALPAGCDAGVLMAWRDAGALFKWNVSSIGFTLRGRGGVRKTTFTPEGLMRIRERITGPRTDVRTIEGRLLMADFKEHGTRCRVHPSVGEPVLCLFGEEQKDAVLENVLHHVRVVGKATESVGGTIASIEVHDMERLEGCDDDASDPPPDAFISQDFWTSPTLDDLAKAQNVGPLDADALFGTWPGDDDDGFEEAIDALRRSGLKKDVRS